MGALVANTIGEVVVAIIVVLLIFVGIMVRKEMKQSGGTSTKNMYVLFFMGALVFALYTYIHKINI
jgi:hypothetical protein